MVKISVVFPVYNEASNLNVLYGQVKQALLKSNVNYEMIFVDNGSNDDSLSIIKHLLAQDSQVKYISLSRNFGHQNALFAGLFYCNGDAVITMDADLQHPPTLIPDMIDLWRQGTEVVFTIKRNTNLPFLKHLFVKFFYWLMSKISGLQFHLGQSDFRLIDKKVLECILKMPECHKFLRGQIGWLGFNQRAIMYDVQPRYSGESKFSFKDLFLFALDGIFSFSKYPLRLMTILGMFSALFSILYFIFDVLLLWILKIFNMTDLPFPPGWMTLASTIVFLGSVQLLAIGILGEYLGRVFDQTKNRPVFIVRETLGIEHE